MQPPSARRTPESPPRTEIGQAIRVAGLGLARVPSERPWRRRRYASIHGRGTPHPQPRPALSISGPGASIGAWVTRWPKACPVVVGSGSAVGMGLRFDHVSCEAPERRPRMTTTANERTEANRETVRDAFEAWRDGTSPITDPFAPGMVWRIEDWSLASSEYRDQQRFVDEVLTPFAARFAASSDPFRPVAIRSVHPRWRHRDRALGQARHRQRRRTVREQLRPVHEDARRPGRRRHGVLSTTASRSTTSGIEWSPNSAQSAAMR
jgi:hypothetical protein